MAPKSATNTGAGFLPNLFKKQETSKTPVGGIGTRVKNACKNNFRGLIGVLVPIFVLTYQIKKEENDLKVELMWMWMFWFYMIQPVSIPATGLIPLFTLPMSGVMMSNVTCGCYMNESVMLYILGAMLILLLNNSGVDRRIAVWFICSGNNSQYSGKKLVFKTSTAAFFLSMISSRLIVTSTLTEIMTNALTKLDSSTFSKGGDSPNFVAMRNVVNNAIQTASGIGSIAILHASYATILFRGGFAQFAPMDKEYPDIFNYLHYSAFAFPLAFVMFLLNVIYHMILVDSAAKKKMSGDKMGELKNILKKNADEIPPKMSLHEKLSVVFLIIMMAVFYFRWSDWIIGWSEFRRDINSPQIPRITDVTTGSIFLILLHILPKGYSFMKILRAKKKSDLPAPRPESAILWWRFVDRNVNYGYIFTFGSSYAIIRAATLTELDHTISQNIGLVITDKPWNAGLFICIFIAALLCNLTTALAACGIWLPFVLCMSVDAPVPWPGKLYVAALGVGIASSFGFCIPFQYTPAYYCHNTGKVPIMTMVKYSFASVWICLISLYVALLVWAPVLFDPEDVGIFPVAAPDITTTTGGAPPAF